MAGGMPWPSSGRAPSSPGSDHLLQPPVLVLELAQPLGVLTCIPENLAFHR
jgi:hypothetical protein